MRLPQGSGPFAVRVWRGVVMNSVRYVFGPSLRLADGHQGVPTVAHETKRKHGLKSLA